MKVERYCVFPNGVSGTARSLEAVLSSRDDGLVLLAIYIFCIFSSEKSVSRALPYRKQPLSLEQKAPQTLYAPR